MSALSFVPSNPAWVEKGAQTHCLSLCVFRMAMPVPPPSSVPSPRMCNRIWSIGAKAEMSMSPAGRAEIDALTKVEERNTN